MHKLGFVMQKPGFIMQKLGSSGQEPCFTRFQPRQWFIDPLVVIHPYVSRHTWLFSMHSVQLLLVHTLWDAMHACLYRLQALCHRYDMGSWVGGCF